jgi:hypothetical protein
VDVTFHVRRCVAFMLGNITNRKHFHLYYTCCRHVTLSCPACKTLAV